MFQFLIPLLLGQGVLEVQGLVNFFPPCTKVIVNPNYKPSISKYPEETQVLQFSEITEAKKIKLLAKDLACVSVEINSEGALEAVNMSEILQFSNNIPVLKKGISVKIDNMQQIQVDNSFHCMGYFVDVSIKDTARKIEMCSSDLSKTPINVTYYCIFPFCYPNLSFEGVQRGLAGYVFNEVKTKLKLDVEYIPTQGYSKSIDDNGNIVGLVGMVSSRQAEFGIGGTFVTWDRFQTTDYNYNFYQTALGFCCQPPKKLDTLFKILNPLSKETWIGVLISLVSVTATFELVDRALLGGQHSLFFNLALGIQVLLSETHIADKGAHKTKKFVSHQILRWFWFSSGTIISMAYSSTLLTHLVLQDFEKPLDTAEDILKAEVQVQVLDGSLLQTLLSQSSRPILQELYQKRTIEQNGLMPTYEFNDEKWQRLQREKNAVMACPDGTAMAGDYHFSKETFYTATASHLVAKGSSFKQPADWVISHIVAGGLVEKYFLQLIDMKRKDDGKAAVSILHSERPPQPLEFRHFEGSLVLWLVFSLLSVGIFLIEITLSANTKKGKMRRN